MPPRTRLEPVPAAVALTWVAYFAVLQWSVVRFRVPIVLVLTACTLALAWWQWAAPAVTAAHPAVGRAVLAGRAGALTVPLFSYLPAPRAAVATTLLGRPCSARSRCCGPARSAAALTGRVVIAWRTPWVRPRRSSATRRPGSTSG